MEIQSINSATGGGLGIAPFPCLPCNGGEGGMNGYLWSKQGGSPQLLINHN